MRNIRMRYLPKAGPTKAGREFMANHVEAKALAAVRHAERVVEPEQQYLTRDFAPPEVKNPLLPPANKLDRPASKQVRQYAEENGIDLAKVVGTGKGGRIVKADVTEAIKSAASEQ